jgi:hypothetical protein
MSNEHVHPLFRGIISAHLGDTEGLTPVLDGTFPDDEPSDDLAARYDEAVRLLGRWLDGECPAQDTEAFLTTTDDLRADERSEACRSDQVFEDALWEELHGASDREAGAL